MEICVEPDEGGFHAYCPALKGLHTSGRTKKEAVENAVNAAKIYLESSIKHGDPIPVGIITCEQTPRRVVAKSKGCASLYTENLQIAYAI
ncbi:MAG: type II toxin-antitoxin system HicB family antitoxin [Dehalococcoidia bacterium]|nr:type II toxin-antitoxin system HicB family antitoxin [Dehalococcoidia bacterium]